MNIAFTDLKIKQTGNNVMNVSLTESVPGLPTPVEQKSTTVDTTTLNPAQLKTVNDFIALLKSKL